MRTYNYFLSLGLLVALIWLVWLVWMPVVPGRMASTHRVPSASWRLMRRYACPKNMACVASEGLNWDYRWSRVQ